MEKLFKELIMKKALITGASGKVGRVLAKLLTENGYKLLLHHNKHHYRKDGFIEKDLSSSQACEGLIDEAFSLLGGLDLLVHTAGIFEKKPLGTVTADDWERSLAIDLKAAFFLSQRAGLRMRDRGNGSIIFMSDAAADEPYLSYMPYSIAKAGVNCLVKALARALAPTVKVNGVAPKGSAPSPEEIAGAAVELVEFGRSGEIRSVG